jgi:NAD(P)-dependent dehydrogenase (short-subunit alcohol dehydrogenase family)
MAGYALDGKRVFVAGHRGMVGAALVRRLGTEGCTILTAPRAAADLRRQDASANGPTPCSSPQRGSAASSRTRAGRPTSSTTT